MGVQGGLVERAAVTAVLSDSRTPVCMCAWLRGRCRRRTGGEGRVGEGGDSRGGIMYAVRKVARAQLCH